MKTAQERYQTDVEFRYLVDMIEALYSRGKYTPSELREAAILAATHFEMKTVRLKVFYDEKNIL